MDNTGQTEKDIRVQADYIHTWADNKQDTNEHRKGSGNSAKGVTEKQNSEVKQEKKSRNNETGT